MSVSKPLWVLLLFVLAALIIACAPLENKKIGTPADPAQNQAPIIKIGVSLPLTGPAASTIGTWTMNGLQLALERYSGPESKRITLVIEDDQCLPTVGLTVAHKLVEQEGIHYLIGPLCGAVIQATTPFYDDQKILRMQTTMGMEAHKKMGSFKFALSGYVHDLMKGLATYTLEHRIQTISVIYLDDEYGKENLEGFERYYSGIILSKESYAPGTTDFRTQLLKIKQQRPEGILLVAYGPYLVNILKQMDEMGIVTLRLSLMNTQDPSILAGAGSLAEGIIFPVPVDRSQSNVKSWFERRYIEKYNQSAEITSSSAFDSLNAIFQAIDVCGDDTKCAKERLENLLQSYPGASGVVSIDQYGVATRSGSIKMISNGSFVFIDS